jgi:transcriptional regulator with XRE-family HTH domain
MLNQRIRELRTLRSISQVELAAALGVTKQSVSNWENDNIQPSIDILIKLAKYFNVSTDYLLALDDREVLDVSGLSKEAVTHMRMLIEDFINI